MAYSSASDVKWSALGYFCWIARTVILLPACLSLLLWQVCGKHLWFHWLVSVMVPGGWLPLTGLSWLPYEFGSVLFVASPSFLGTIPQACLLLMSLTLPDGSLPGFSLTDNNNEVIIIINYLLLPHSYWALSMKIIVNNNHKQLILTEPKTKTFYWGKYLLFNHPISKLNDKISQNCDTRNIGNCKYTEIN